MLACAVVLFAALVAVCWLRPFWPLRVLLWLLTHSFYRLRRTGFEQLPSRGPVLLVCNALNRFEWLLLLAAVRRPVRIVLFSNKIRSWLRRGSGAILVDGSAGARAIAKALRETRAALARGEAVCLFADNHATTGGLQLPFHRVFPSVVRRCPVPIVPVNLEQPWGSLLYPDATRGLWKWPQQLPYPVYAAFGPPLPAGTPAAEVRQAVQRLSAERAVARAACRRPVHRQFVRTAARHPFRTCILDNNLPARRLSYGRCLAGAMCALRVLRPILGDAPMVGVWLPPSAGAALLNIVLAFLRKTSVNLNYSSSPEVVQSALRQCGCRHVVTSRRFTARMKLDPGPGIEVIYFEDLAPRIGHWMRWTRWLMVVLLPGFVLERWVLRLGRHNLDDLATVIFSSGSTGEPKGVMLSHGNVAANVESMIQTVSLARHDRALGVLPFFHSFGYTVTLWAPLQVGASVVYHADPRQAREIGELCREHRCTIYLSTATFLRFCLKKCEPGDFRSLRVLVCGAEKLPVSLAQEFERKFGVLPMEGYGCTELSPVTATNLPDHDHDGFRRITNRPGTVGQPIPGVAARVVHPDTRQPLPPGGVEGLLLIYGANVMRGYLGRPDLTAEVLTDGWYVTGDMGHIDADGFITLTGRLSRFAKCGGEMVPLERVEEELHDVLGTTERVCAVTCVPDDSRGERVVVLYLGLHLEQHNLETRAWCQRLGGRGLPNLWVPSERDFFAVSEIPILPSGKVDLKRVKLLALEMARK